MSILSSNLTQAANFSIKPLSNVYKQELIKNGLWRPSCPVALDRLRNLTISYYDFEGNEHNDGHMIVLDTVSDYVLEIFKQLYKEKFPIHKIELVSNYAGDDEKSMQANNTSSFNCRNVTHSTSNWSLHAYGLAIDINPVQNPFLEIDDGFPGRVNILPPSGTEYLNRLNKRAGMVDSLVESFYLAGFVIWGGHWNTPIDYMHFQTSREMAEKLAGMSPAEAEKFYKEYTEELKQKDATPRT